MLQRFALPSPPSFLFVLPFSPPHTLLAAVHALRVPLACAPCVAAPPLVCVCRAPHSLAAALGGRQHHLVGPLTSGTPTHPPTHTTHTTHATPFTPCTAPAHPLLCLCAVPCAAWQRVCAWPLTPPHSSLFPALPSSPLLHLPARPPTPPRTPAPTPAPPHGASTHCTAMRARDDVGVAHGGREERQGGG